MSGMSASARATLELASLEMEAKAIAKHKVANLLQRPDQLDKVEAIQKRVVRKKASVEAMLKTAVQSQLDGVRTGMNQLHNALQDVREIRDKLAEIEDFYKSVEGLEDKLEQVAEENSKHSQLAAAVENLKHIFTVPETLKKCEEYISDGKLLHAHKCLTDLERSRDDLLFELHRQTSASPTDTNTVNHYFAGVDKLSESLGKQLWLLLQRTLQTLQRDQTVIVSVLRIIEREERNDTLMMKRYHQSDFMPPSRPKRWRQRAFDVLKEATAARIEGNQMEDRTMNNMWLVRHLEVTRQIVIEDLKVIKTLCEPCFPPYYDIINKYVEMYHNCISQHLMEIISQGLEGNEVVTLLTWVNDYLSTDMMGSPVLSLDMSEYDPVLEPSVITELQNTYLHNMRTNFQEWMGNSLKEDSADWYREQGPDADHNGYYHTSLPVILPQMIKQNLQVASTISETLVQKAAALCMDELAFFIRTYKVQVQSYRDKHYQDRNQPQYFLQYMVANVNNCQSLAIFSEEIRVTHTAQDMLADQDRFKTVTKMFHDLQSELYAGLLEEVFLDLDSHIQELVTRKWLPSSLAVDTICVTVEDYCGDFRHLKPEHYDSVLERARTKVATEYIKAMFTRKMTFKNFQERGPAAEKIAKEADQLSRLFTKLSNQNVEECPFQVLCSLSEILKLRDGSMLSLELAGFTHQYPDIRTDQMVELLLMRGDLGRNEARQIVVDSFGEDHNTKPIAKKTILSKME